MNELSKLLVLIDGFLLLLHTIESKRKSERRQIVVCIIRDIITVTQSLTTSLIEWFNYNQYMDIFISHSVAISTIKSNFYISNKISICIFPAYYVYWMFD